MLINQSFDLVEKLNEVCVQKQPAKENSMDNRTALGKEKISKLIWQFSLPAITGMLVNALYNIIDSIFVGHGIGAIGLAAVTIAFPVMIILMGFGMLVGVGATTLISIRLGEQQKEAAERILGTAATLGIVLALGLAALFLFLLDPILIILGADASVLPYTREFLIPILSGNVFMFIGFGLNNIIRAEGHPKKAMSTMLLSAFINTLLNPLFIFVLGLGIKGSALATVISQAVSAGWVVWHFTLGDGFLKLRFKNLRLERAITLDILSMGSSAFFMQVAASMVAGLFNYILTLQGGQTAVAAMGIINRISMLILMPLFGISQGTQPIIGYNYGARNYSRVKETVITGSLIATGVSIAGFVLIQVFDTYIIRLFSTDPELIQLGATGLRIFMSMLPVIGFQIIGVTLFQAIGKPKKSLILSMSRQILILVPALLILPHFWGLWGVWLSGPLSDLGSTIATIILVVRQLKTLSTKIP